MNKQQVVEPAQDQNNLKQVQGSGLASPPKIDINAVNDTTVLSTADSSLPQAAAPAKKAKANYTKLVVFFVSALAVIGIATGLALIVLDDGLDTYTFRGQNISIGYPSGWGIDDEGRSIVVEFNEPLEIRGEHQANIDVTLINTTQTPELDSIKNFESFTEQLQSIIASNSNTELRSSKQQTIGGRQTYIYNVDVKNHNQTGESGFSTSYIVKINESLYVSIDMDGHESDSGYQSILKKMVESIKATDNQ